MSIAPRRDFIWDHNEPVPHLGRQRALLKLYPQLKELMKPEPLTKYIILGVVTLQIIVSWYISDKPWYTILFFAYFVGAFANSNMFLVTHELCHRLASTSRAVNKILTIIANLPIGLPFGITFGPYHQEHHMYMGQEGLDTDLPTAAEALIFGNPDYSYPMRCLMKGIFMFTQIFFYAIRPMAVRPETMSKLQTDPWYIANTVTQFAFDGIVMYFWGYKPILYFLLSTFVAGSFHPLAGHFLAEHYEFQQGVSEASQSHETYSYYGPLNFFVYNAGYHNEHHDFPNIPWTSLPKVREICKDYYDTIPECKSWTWCVVRYIFDDSVGPYSRKKRPTVLGAHVPSHNQMMEKFINFLKNKSFDFKENATESEASNVVKNAIAAAVSEDGAENDHESLQNQGVESIIKSEDMDENATEKPHLKAIKTKMEFTSDTAKNSGNKMVLDMQVPRQRMHTA